MTTNTDTLNSLSVIKVPDTSSSPYYCTEDEWRNFTGFTSQIDFPSSEVALHLENATEQLKKDAFHMVRWELVTKDSSDRRFTMRKYWANRYGTASDDQTQIIHGQVTKYDLEVFEADVTSSVAASLWLQGTRVNRLMYRIPYEGITDLDPLNCWFKLSSDYPTSSSRQIFVTYWVSGKPLDEIGYELKRACMEMTTILALNKLKSKRIKKGITSYTIGKQTVTHDEENFDKVIDQHKQEYEKFVRWLKPFIGRRAKIGRLETEDYRRWSNMVARI